MLSAFIDRFSNVSVLSAFSLPKAERVFRHMGWESAYGLNQQKRYFKITRSSLPSVNELPDGRVIAVVSKADLPHSEKCVDFYEVKNSLTHYPMKYFQIDLNEDGSLR